MYNDFELIYLIQCHYDRGARDILFNKYKPLIYKIVLNYIYDKSLVKDYVQFSYLKLEKAYTSFYPDLNKTFTRYFELILKRDIFKMIKKSYKDTKSVILEENTIDFLNNNYENIEFLEEETKYKFIKEYNFKSLILNDIYKLIYIENKPIKDVINILNIEPKKVYNAIYRIKNKIKNELKS